MLRGELHRRRKAIVRQQNMLRDQIVVGHAGSLSSGFLRRNMMQKLKLVQYLKDDMQSNRGDQLSAGRFYVLQERIGALLHDKKTLIAERAT